MPLALLAALAGSMAIHVAAFFLPDVELSTVPETSVIKAELQPPPQLSAPVAVRRPAAPSPGAQPHANRHRAKPAKAPAAPAGEPVVAAAMPETEPEPALDTAAQSDPQPELVAAAEPRLPSQGYIRFSVLKGSAGLLVGRAEHRWEFEDGHYRLLALTETIGLAALVKPIRIELESLGELTAGGLQPDHFATRRNGNETNENADFDWNAGQLTLGRDGSRHEMTAGAQDLLSFHYQLGYLAGLENGTRMGVATGKKFERYQFDALGEESLETPAGRFRTLHLRVRTDSTTELWLALDRQRLPVKIRYTDRKGESFEQVATELGM